MDQTTRTHLDNLCTDDRALQNEAFTYVLDVTEKSVDWAYDVWNTLIANLSDKDNHCRAIAAQVLCNLAKSDPDKRILKDFDALLNVTKDKKFVTARHCMQALWKVGAAGKDQQHKYMDGLTGRFNECISEKNCTLIRYDIIQSLRNVYDAVHDVSIKTRALELIATEDDLKYRKKYAGVWKGV